MMKPFRKFYIENKEKFFGYLLRQTGNYHLSSDIMQESFTRCLERYADREESSALLYTIGRNLLYDHSRKSRGDASYDDELHGSGIDQEETYGIKEEYQRVLRAMQKLDDEERDILSLVVSSGLTYREIAKITGNSEGNIKVKIHRSRTKLKTILRQE